MPPAIPPGPPDDGTSPPLAPVTDLAARRTRHDPPPPTGLTPDESLKQAADHWEGIFADAGMDLRTPAAELLPVVAAELERLVGGLLYVRAGGGPRDLPPNSEAGVDLTSAMEFVSLLRELGAVPEVLRARAGE